MPMPFYVKLESQKQGIFAGDAVTQSRQAWTEGLAFRYALTSPRDPVTGMPTGKPQHSVTFVKRWSRSSPQLFEASVNNELLTRVTFEFVLPASGHDATEQVFQRTTLEAVTIISMRQSIEESALQTADMPETEEIALTFRSITLENLLAGGPRLDLVPVFDPSIVGNVSVPPSVSMALDPSVVGNITFPSGSSGQKSPSGSHFTATIRPGQRLQSGGVQSLGNPNLPKWGRFAPGQGSPNTTIG